MSNTDNQAESTQPKSSKTIKNEKLIEEYKQYYPVFRLKSVSNEMAICKYIGNIKNTEKLYDIPLDLSGGEDVKENYGEFLGKFGDYDVGIKGSICNIAGSYLLTNKKIPIYYVNILYDKRFVSGFVLGVFCYFTFSEESAKKLMIPKQYVNAAIYGNYTIEIESDYITKFRDDCRNIIADKKMTEYAELFESCDDVEKEDLLAEIDKEIESEVSKYDTLFDPINVTKIGKKHVVKSMVDLCKNPLFKLYIEYCLRQREQERKEKSCPDLDFKVPTKIMNLQELGEFNDDDLDKKLDELIVEKSDSSDDE